MQYSDVFREFQRLGSRVHVRSRFDLGDRFARVDIDHDRSGERFRIDLGPGASAAIADARPDLQQLVLLIDCGQDRYRYLCGRDENRWFVAAVPDKPGAETVPGAFEALKPVAVVQEQDRLGISPRDRLLRRNEAYVRQGEWFFVPRPDVWVDVSDILFNEPISRGRGGKPHMVEHLHRTGGEMVHVCDEHPLGLSDREHRELLQRDIEARKFFWRLAARDARVLAHGRISHPDHETIRLSDWHEVHMNTEGDAPGAEDVAFLD